MCAKKGFIVKMTPLSIVRKIAVTTLDRCNRRALAGEKREML
jgi:hypothetical protein